MYTKSRVWRFVLLAAVLCFAVQSRGLQAAERRAMGEAMLGKETAVCGFPVPDHQVYLPIIFPSGEETTPAPEPVIRELQYEVGKTYYYRYETTSSSVFGTVDKENGISAQTPEVTLSYGTAKISITDMEEGDIFVGQIVLDSPVMCTQHENSPDEFGVDDELLEDLQTPLIFRQHKNGVIVDLQIANEVDPLSANYLKSILNSLQATLTEDNDYPAIENGWQGNYVAHYTAALQQHGILFSRTINEDSFIEFYSQGDEPGIILDNTVHSFLDRETGVFSSVNFYETTNIVGEDPEDMNVDEGIGIGLWGKTLSSGSIRLTAVEDTPANKIAVPSAATYSIADMSAAFGELHSSTHGINIEAIDLDAELDALEAEPENPDIFQRLTWIVAAGDSDSDNPALNAIAARLNANIGNEDIAIAYIDLLGSDGSPHAQNQLLSLIDPNNPDIGSISPRLQEKAIVNLALVEKPQPAAYNMMETIKADTTNTVQTQTVANQALGAMVPALRQCDPDAAERIYADLETQLAAATTDAEVYQQLLALGNTESPELLTLVQPYMTSPDPRVQWAAYWALRDVPGQEAEDLLLAAFDEPIDPGYPLPAAAITLKNRPGKPSDNVNQTLDNPWPPPPQGATIMKPWGRTFGNDYIGGGLPGYFVWESPPYAERLRAEVSQSLDYYLNIPQFNNYSKQGTFASAAAFTNPKEGNNAVQEFGYNYSILGKTFDAVYNVPCADNGGDTISKGFIILFNYTYEFPVWGPFVVGTTMQGTANYKIDYTYAWDLCNVADMSGEVNIIPHAKLAASADAHLRLGKTRGGIRIKATIIDVDVLGNLHATYNFNDGFEACADIELEWEAMKTHLVWFVERYKKSENKWIPKLGDTLWENNPPGGSADIFPNECWVP